MNCIKIQRILCVWIKFSSEMVELLPLRVRFYVILCLFPFLLFWRRQRNWTQPIRFVFERLANQLNTFMMRKTYSSICVYVIRIRICAIEIGSEKKEWTNKQQNCTQQKKARIVELQIKILYERLNKTRKKKRKFIFSGCFWIFWKATPCDPPSYSYSTQLFYFILGYFFPTTKRIKTEKSHTKKKSNKIKVENEHSVPCFSVRFECRIGITHLTFLFFFPNVFRFMKFEFSEWIRMDAESKNVIVKREKLFKYLLLHK